MDHDRGFISDEIKLTKEDKYTNDATPDIYTGVVADIMRKVRDRVNLLDFTQHHNVDEHFRISKLLNRIIFSFII